MRIAITREVSASFENCELTHLSRAPIDVDRARLQHEEYRQVLRRLGCEVVSLPALEDHPDAVFVEDVAIVVDEMAVMARPGAASRAGEVATVADALRPFRELVALSEDAAIDGGDVLRVGRRIYVGESSRTNAAGVRELRRHLEPAGYKVTSVPVSECLHLKSAITCLGDDLVLLNPEWVPEDRFLEHARIGVDRTEPYAANGLRIGGSVVFPQAFPRTAARLADQALDLVQIDVSELAKAEGAVTCCSILVESS